MLVETSTEQRWQSHRFLAAALRGVAFLGPVVAAIAAAVLVSRALPRPDGLVAAALWWLGLTAVSTVVLIAVERVVRRLLPLAALLRLCMLFPDRVPNRFRLALRSGSVSDLRRRLEHPGTTPADAAATVLALLAVLSSHDRATRGHSERVRAYTELLATELRLADRDRDLLRWASLLHDIGKVALPPELLNKPSAPTAAEWEHLRTHPEVGARLVAPLRAWLGEWGDTIEQHHERWDGTGYPGGLAGGDICWGARIVTVADAFETMTSVRPYARPVSPVAARKELAACAGTHFDPDVVRAFLGVSIGRLRLAMGPLAWLGQIPVVGALEDATVRVAWSGVHPTVGGVLGGAAATGVAALLVSGMSPGTTGADVAGADPAGTTGAATAAGPAATAATATAATGAPARGALAGLGLKLRPAAFVAAPPPITPPTTTTTAAPAPVPASRFGVGSPPATGADPTTDAPPSPPAPERHDFGGTPPGHGGTPPGHGGAVPGHGPDHEEREERDGDD